MPISDRNLGKYKVPGIYIEEVDESVIQLPIQEVLINLVPGFSKKGPFNKPVKVNTKQDFEKIFGTIDKGLETKGSFFHRTVNTMLEQGPVWALNLLSTDPTRDKLKWKSISASSQYDNGSLVSSPYENFFNRQDFWERDPDSFNDIVVANNSGSEDTERLLHITNMSDRTITTFLFKSSAKGFDVTAEQWYGGRDKVPLFMFPKDWISDYMISVLVVYGDWTNYDDLSSDSIWSTYFNSTGLIKSKVETFANHNLVTTLAFYDVSLIPGFKDLNNRNMYIKDVINNDTDKTGLFCTYNEDELLNSDYYKGKLDLLGQTLVGNETKKVIDFLSYNESISEYLTFTEKNLNSVGNTFANYGTVPIDFDTAWLSGRTGSWTNWYTGGITATTSSSLTTNMVTCDGTNITLAATTNLSVNDVIYFDKNFSIIERTKAYYVKTIGGSVITVSTERGGPAVTNIVTGSTTDVNLYKIAYGFDNNGGTGYYNIGSTRYYLTGVTDAFLNPFTISTSSSTYSRIDVLYLNSDNTSVKTLQGTQVIGTAPSLPNYILNNTNSIILGSLKTTYTDGVWSFTYSGVTVDNNGYIPLGTSYITTNSGTTTAGVNYLDLIFTGTYGSSSDWTNYTKLRNLKIYNELSTKLASGKGVMIKTNGYKFEISSPSSYDATVSDNARLRIYFDDTESPYDYFDTSTNSFILYYINDEFMVGDGSVSTFTTSMKPQVESTEGIISTYSSLYTSYYDGLINNGDYFFINNDSGSTGTDNRIYMKMYFAPLLTVNFYDDAEMTSSYSISGFDTNYGSELIVYSDKSNWKQTIEIEKPSTIIDTTNTTVIYVNKTRYSEITKGSFLEAYYDTSYYDSPGTGYLNGEVPKKFTRIVNVLNDTVDTTLKILYTDAPIKINYIVTTGSTNDYYTTAYSSIDNYVTDYKGVAITPFIIHSDSIPNATEARQTSILNVIASGTRLAKGLTNKNRISWRYLVDSFGMGLIANSKQQLVDLCGKKINSLGFLNMPSAKLFKKSSNPSFVNSDNSLNMEYIKEGADTSKNPDFYYSFGEGVGQSCVSYWFPYIKTDQESTKFIPPSGEIAKTFMGKFTTINASIKPWTILGGVIRGKLLNVRETEIRFTYDDLESLNEMNSNPIDYVENYGYIINSDNTAQVYPYSSLSLIHSREVLIELENRLYDMLLNYHWRFNTPEIRSEIKYRADQICKELRESDALYAYRNVCDKTNNTDYIIGLQMGILDTYCEVIKGMGIIVNQITILKKGTIESSGFLTP